MSALIVDAISAKTLPMLDNLYATDTKKLENIIMSTPAEPLKRLLLASIARQTVLGYPMDPNLTIASRLIEVLIHNNLLSVPGDTNEADAEKAIMTAGEASQRLLLTISIIRYNTLQ
jgi:hypothetical protein